jgi:hypothetical protein
VRLAALEITVTFDGRGYVATVAGLRAQLNETHATMAQAVKLNAILCAGGTKNMLQMKHARTKTTAKKPMAIASNEAPRENLQLYAWRSRRDSQTGTSWLVRQSNQETNHVRPYLRGDRDLPSSVDGIGKGL